MTAVRIPRAIEDLERASLEALTHVLWHDS